MRLFRRSTHDPDLSALPLSVLAAELARRRLDVRPAGVCDYYATETARLRAELDELLPVARELAQIAGREFPRVADQLTEAWRRNAALADRADEADAVVATLAAGGIDDLSNYLGDNEQ